MDVSANNIASIMETVMVICFGLSWPLSIIRSYRAKTAKGKSIFFAIFIVVGYIAGILAKTITHSFNLAYYFYYINVVMVSIDISLWFRNRRLDQERDGKEARR